MTTWIKPDVKLPPQGKKILAFYDGDCCVVQRIGNSWFPIPFVESIFARIEAPTYWAHIDMPEGYTGKMFLGIDGKIMDIDEAEKVEPQTIKEMEARMIMTWVQSR